MTKSCGIVCMPNEYEYECRFTLCAPELGGVGIESRVSLSIEKIIINRLKFVHRAAIANYKMDFLKP